MEDALSKLSMRRNSALFFGRRSEGGQSEDSFFRNSRTTQTVSELMWKSIFQKDLRRKEQKALS